MVVESVVLGGFLRVVVVDGWLIKRPRNKGQTVGSDLLVRAGNMHSAAGKTGNGMEWNGGEQGNEMRVDTTFLYFSRPMMRSRATRRLGGCFCPRETCFFLLYFRFSIF